MCGRSSPLRSMPRLLPTRAARYRRYGLAPTAGSTCSTCNTWSTIGCISCSPSNRSTSTRSSCSGCSAATPGCCPRPNWWTYSRCFRPPTPTTSSTSRSTSCRASSRRAAGAASRSSPWMVTPASSRMAHSTRSCSPKWRTTTSCSSSACSTTRCSFTRTKLRCALPLGATRSWSTHRPRCAGPGPSLLAASRSRWPSACRCWGSTQSVRFFDSRLYEPLRLRRPGRSAASSPLHIAGILTFRGEHGRNYARVFSQFASELDRARDRVSITAYIITHAECHVPVDLVRRIRETSELYGVFMLPSRGTLELDYLSLLTQHEIVTDAALRDRSERATRAISIVEAASEGVRRDSLTPKDPRLQD